MVLPSSEIHYRPGLGSGRLRPRYTWWRFRCLEGGDVFKRRTGYVNCLCRHWSLTRFPRCSHLVLSPPDSTSRLRTRPRHWEGPGGPWTTCTKGLELPWPGRYLGFPTDVSPTTRTPSVGVPGPVRRRNPVWSIF